MAERDTSKGNTWRDLNVLRQELEEAHKTIKLLMRQLEKEQQRYRETTRAYKLTVANQSEISRENAALAAERDQWRARAENRSQIVVGPNIPFPALTLGEIGALRKALTRLYTPESGGDPERMKLWNALLDPLEEALNRTYR
jgi:hypothetical protein